MNIAQIIPDFPLPGESPYLGPANVVYNLVSGLNNIEPSLSIDIITVNDNVKNYFCSQLLPGVVVHYCPKSEFLSRTVGDPFIVRRVLNSSDYDIIHSHSSSALAFCNELKCPKILTAHTIFYEEKKYEKSMLVKYGYYNLNSFIFKKMLSKIDGFIAISPYVIDELKNIGVYNNIKNIFQINNPIDTSYLEVPLYQNESNIIYYPAKIIERKNQLSAIKSIALVKKEIDDFKLFLSGGYDINYLAKINSEIKKNKLENFVEYKGKVPRNEILQLYQNASLVYLLSYQETQPVSLIESMATGNPSIASNIPSNKYLIDEGITGNLVNYNDYDKISDLTIKLLDDKHLRTKIGLNAKEKAKKMHHPSVIAEKTLNVYNTLAI